MDGYEIAIAVAAGGLALAAVSRLLIAYKGGGSAKMNPEDLKRLLDEGADIVVLDVRSPEELKKDLAPLPGAMNIPLGDLSGRMGEVPKGKKIVVVCKMGQRSAMAAGALVKAGYADVSNLAGGMAAYRRKFG